MVLTLPFFRCSFKSGSQDWPSLNSLHHQAPTFAQKIRGYQKISLYQDSDIIIISDSGHHSQNDSLASSLTKKLHSEEKFANKSVGWSAGNRNSYSLSNNQRRRRRRRSEWVQVTLETASSNAEKLLKVSDRLCVYGHNNTLLPLLSIMLSRFKNKSLHGGFRKWR